LLRAEKLAKSYGGMTRNNLSQKKRADHTVHSSFGSSAIFSFLKIRRFPSPPCGRFGFIGIRFFEIIFPLEAFKSWMQLTI
jgi:hypothetical protein